MVIIDPNVFIIKNQSFLTNQYNLINLLGGNQAVETCVKLKIMIKLT